MNRFPESSSSIVVVVVVVTVYEILGFLCRLCVDSRQVNNHVNTVLFSFYVFSNLILKVSTAAVTVAFLQSTGLTSEEMFQK